MANETTKVVHITVGDFKAQYDEVQGIFRLTIPGPLSIEGVEISSLKVDLPEGLIRQMAELLSPLDPESVH